MTRSSRYVRPSEPMPVLLQPRDRQVLRAVREHRYLHSDHIRDLLFGGASLRVTTRRLRKLWEHRLLDRYYKPTVIFDGMPGPRTSRPLYMLARRGALVLADELGCDVSGIPHTPEQNAVGFATLDHHLVVTDFFVALTCAIRRQGDVALARTVRESAMRSRQAALRRARGRALSGLVSDGAVSLRCAATGQTRTFHIEVVRADVRGGNKTLIKKLGRYADLHHRGFFARVYDQADVRAILIATTSDARAQNLRALSAQNLAHGRRLFWFGVYRAPAGERTTLPAFDADTVLSPMWTDVDGQTHSLIEPEGTSPRASVALG